MDREFSLRDSLKHAGGLVGQLGLGQGQRIGKRTMVFSYFPGWVY